MPKYLVFKSIDAFANYAGMVEAANAAEARRIAEEQNDEIGWSLHSVSEFDDVDFDNFEPELAEDFAVGPSDAEIIAEMLTALKACRDVLSAQVENGTCWATEEVEAAAAAIAKAEGRVHG